MLASACDSRVGITIGCHPHFADQMSGKRWLQMERLIANNDNEYPGPKMSELFASTTM